jgi:hypothetical protein
MKAIYVSLNAGFVCKVFIFIFVTQMWHRRKKMFQDYFFTDVTNLIGLHGKGLYVV